MFKAALSAADKSAIQGAIAVIDQHLRAVGGRQSKAKKSLDSMSGEIAQGGNAILVNFSNSVLGEYLTLAGSLNATEVAALRADVKAKRFAAVRTSLEKAKLWIWSGAPEAVLMPDAAAEAVVETVLIQNHVLAGPLNGPNRRTALLQKLHSLGHKPEVLEAVVRALHTSRMLRGRELRDVVARVIA